MNQKAILLSLFLSVNILTTIEASAGLTFHERVNLHRSGKGSKIEKVRNISSNRHFIFVPGFAKEVIDFWSNNLPSTVRDTLSIWTGYFVTMEEVVRNEFGASSEKVPSHVSNSWRTVDDGAEGLRQYIENSFLHHRKPIILVGHSKGGAEILYTLLKYPYLMEQMVDRVLLIQAAIGGSALIEEEHQSTSLRKKLVRNLAHSMGLMQTLRSLKPSVAQGRVQELYEQFQTNVDPDLQRKMSNRVFYLRSSMTKGNESWASYIARTVASVNLHEINPDQTHEDGPQNGTSADLHLGHDGFIRVEDQFLEKFGVDLGIFKDDHSFLAIDGWLSTTSKQEKLPIARAVFEHIFDQELFEQLEDPGLDFRFQTSTR